MKILFLGPRRSPLLEWLCGEEAEVVQTDAKLAIADLLRVAPDFIVSHGYRHRITPEAIEAVEGRAVNLHISLLPWNRGADPNLWSFLDDTPKGVTIHYVDARFDTGDIIAQTRMEFDPNRETLATSHAALQLAIERLFRLTWPAIRAGTCPRRPQSDGGSSHRVRDAEDLLRSLPLGWGTPVRELTPTR